MNVVKYALIGGDVVTPERVIKSGCVLIENHKITKVLEELSGRFASEYDIIDCAGRVVMPGFIDVHTHGGAGCDFTDDARDTFSKLSQYYYSHGVTTLLATLSPLPHSLLIPAVERLAGYCLEKKDESNIVGIHLEGPYINRSMSGGNQVEYIELPDFDRWRDAFEAGKGFIRLMTVAPELPGIIPVIDDAMRNGVAIAIGHSVAGGETMVQMINKGAAQVTHLFNSMPKLHHREDGLLAEALLSDKIDAQLIADGIHVHPRIIEIALRLKTPDHIMLITDSTRATEVGDGEYVSAGKKVVVKDGVVRAADGALAGSTLTMDRAAKLMNEVVGLDLPAVSRVASLTAARALGIGGETGSIEEGKNADIVVLSKHRVDMTMGEGMIKYRA